MSKCRNIVVKTKKSYVSPFFNYKTYIKQKIINEKSKKK